MENPNTWTPLHYAINEAYSYSAPTITHTQAVHSLLVQVKPSITLEEVQKVIDSYNDDLAEGVCGSSLANILITTLL